MVKHPLSLCAVMLTALLTVPITAMAEDTAPDPEAVAQRCVDDVTALANRCIVHNRGTARLAVATIERLLAAGHEQRARHVAYRATMDIVETSDDCVNRIHRKCRHCIHVLKRLGADELARRVHEVCKTQTHRVRRSQHAALQAIHQAIAGCGGA